MPYADPEKQRRAKRESARRCRAVKSGTTRGTDKGVEPPELEPLRIQTARDVLEVIAEQLNAVRADRTLKTTDRARAVGYLAAVALRAVDAADMEGRLSAIERALANRAAAPDTPEKRKRIEKSKSPAKPSAERAA